MIIEAGSANLKLEKEVINVTVEPQDHKERRNLLAENSHLANEDADLQKKKHRAKSEVKRRRTD